MKPATTEDLFRDYGWLVDRLAGRAHRRWRSTPLEDHVGSGRVGLLDAWHRWEEGRGASFRTYASYRVWGEMVDAARRWSGYRAHHQRVYLDPLPEGFDLPGDDDTEASAVDACIAEHAIRLVRELPETQRLTIFLYFWTPATLKQIGAMFGVTEAAISLRITSAVDRIRPRLVA